MSEIRAFCHFIATHATELAPAGVGIAFRQVLQLAGCGTVGAVVNVTVQHALDTLAQGVMRRIEVFQPLRISVMLHSMVRNFTVCARYKTSLLSELERRAETTSEEFKALEIANSLRAFAKLEAKPGEQLMDNLASAEATNASS